MLQSKALNTTQRVKQHTNYNTNEMEIIIQLNLKIELRKISENLYDTQRIFYSNDDTTHGQTHKII